MNLSCKMTDYEHDIYIICDLVIIFSILNYMLIRTENPSFILEVAPWIKRI